MRLAITGGSGSVGSAVVEQALARGDEVINIDRANGAPARDGLRQVLADVGDYDALVAALRGCDAVIHLAAIPFPFQDPDHVVHNNNVVGSYNVMRAAVEVGIRRICQASSVNAIGLAFSREAHFDYLPIDEAHPNHAEEAYGLSKWICEQQADVFARRYDDVQISSLRFHWVVEDKAIAARLYNIPDQATARHLWGYVLREPAARACLLAVDERFRGHEVFYIVAPDSTNSIPSLELAARYHPAVPVRGDLSGTRSFFNCAKAERMLGWRHE
jgi:UDP-glucose 4-epimerase